MNGGGRTLEIFTIPYYFCKVFPLQFSEQKAQKEEKCFWKKNLRLNKIFFYQKNISYYFSAKCFFRVTFLQTRYFLPLFFGLRLWYHVILLWLYPLRLLWQMWQSQNLLILFRWIWFPHPIMSRISGQRKKINYFCDKSCVPFQRKIKYAIKRSS